MMEKRTCRFCNSELEKPFLDLGMQPSANSLLSETHLRKIKAGEFPEPVSPLRVLVCGDCWLVQLADFSSPQDLFTDDYVYYSSFSASWVAHARRYVEMITDRLGLDGGSQVVEIASNDGYLLQHFVASGIPCYGIDPAAKAAHEAKKKGIETIVDFFGKKTATQLADTRGKADLILGNNVLAHVPTINDFVAGLGQLLNATGVITMEFPHLAKLIENTQFDTIYDEHYFYLSLLSVQKIFAAHDLTVFDVEEIPTHGGSLRIFARHAGNKSLPESQNISSVIEHEKRVGLNTVATYEKLQKRVEAIRSEFHALIKKECSSGKKIVAFGAAAKGNTFLNYCDVGHEHISLVADDTLAKQGRFLPGSHIPIVPEEDLRKSKPNLVLILPWNFKDEIINKLGYIREWGGRFVTCIPRIQIW